jgi:ADP-heptose:LPS heptosyltransferase
MSPLPRNPNPRSLLVIKPSSLGDIVHALQVVQPVAKRYPGCKITWVARDRFAPLVEAAPFVHEVIYFHRKNGTRGVFEVIKALRARNFDIVWDMQGLLRTGLMTAAARSPMKWGRCDCREGASLFSRKVAFPVGRGPHHAIPVLQEFARTLGIEEDVAIPLSLHPSGIFSWQSFFERDPRKCFVIFTDSRGPEKEWKGFDALTRLIFEKFPDSHVAWCAGQPTVPDFTTPEGKFLNLTGCPFDEMVALARQPSIFIGNDSGPMHLSAAVGNRVLAIFGPTPPERFGPWPLSSLLNRSIVAPEGNLNELTAEAVLNALEQLIELSS